MTQIAILFCFFSAIVLPILAVAYACNRYAENKIEQELEQQKIKKIAEQQQRALWCQKMRTNNNSTILEYTFRCFQKQTKEYPQSMMIDYRYGTPEWAEKSNIIFKTH